MRPFLSQGSEGTRACDFMCAACVCAWHVSVQFVCGQLDAHMIKATTHTSALLTADVRPHRVQFVCSLCAACVQPVSIHYLSDVKVERATYHAGGLILLSCSGMEFQSV